MNQAAGGRPPARGLKAPASVGYGFADCQLWLTLCQSQLTSPVNPRAHSPPRSDTAPPVPPPTHPVQPPTPGHRQRPGSARRRTHLAARLHPDRCHPPRRRRSADATATPRGNCPSSSPIDVSGTRVALPCHTLPDTVRTATVSPIVSITTSAVEPGGVASPQTARGEGGGYGGDAQHAGKSAGRVLSAGDRGRVDGTGHGVLPPESGQTKAKAPTYSSTATHLPRFLSVPPRRSALRFPGPASGSPLSLNSLADPRYRARVPSPAAPSRSAPPPPRTPRSRARDQSRSNAGAAARRSPGR